MNPYLYIVPVFWLMIATEFCLARARGRDLYRFQDTVTSLNAGLVSQFINIMGGAFKPVRQIRIAFWNLQRLDTQPTLWGTTDAERWGALDAATHKLSEQFKKPEQFVPVQF